MLFLLFTILLLNCNFVVKNRHSVIKTKPLTMLSIGRVATVWVWFDFDQTHWHSAYLDRFQYPSSIFLTAEGCRVADKNLKSSAISSFLFTKELQVWIYIYLDNVQCFHTAWTHLTSTLFVLSCGCFENSLFVLHHIHTKAQFMVILSWPRGFLRCMWILGSLLYEWVHCIP